MHQTWRVIVIQMCALSIRQLCRVPNLAFASQMRISRVITGFSHAPAILLSLQRTFHKYPACVRDLGGIRGALH